MGVNLRKRGDIWYLDFYYNGKRCRISTNTSKRNLAELSQKEIELQVFKGQYNSDRSVYQGGANLNDLFGRYLEHSRTTKTKETHKTDRVASKVWREYFARKGIKRPDQVSHAVITEFQIESASQFSARYFNNLLGILKTIFNYGIEWGMVKSNPITRYKKIKIAKKLRLFHDEEMEQLWSIASPRIRVIITLGAYAGFRRAEMVNLRWEDIDWVHKTVHIRSDETVTPKGKRPRSTPMHKTLALALKAYRGKSRTNGMGITKINK